MNKLLFFFTFSYITICFSQSGGESVYSFLNLPTSARQMSLGGNIITIEGDVNMPLWNPATIDSTINRNLGSNYTSYLAGINLGSVVYATKINKNIGVFHGGFTYLNYGDLTRADNSGNITGEFKAFDLAISIGYSHHIKKINLTLGTNIKLINSSIDTFSSLGIATDLALLYKSKRSKLVMSFVVRNIGFQLKRFDESNENLPMQMAFGFSNKLEHLPLKWYVTVDNLQQWDISSVNPSNQIVDIEGEISDEKIGFFENALRHTIFGVEMFPEKKITIRLGYNYRRAKELSIINKRTSAGLSYGFGLRLKKLRLSYALTTFHPDSNSNTFSLILDFDK